MFQGQFQKLLAMEIIAEEIGPFWVLTILKMTGGSPEVRSNKNLTFIDISYLIFYILHLTYDILHSSNRPMDQWANGPMDQWTNGPTDQWTNGPIDQWTNGPVDQWTNGPMV